MNLRNESMFFLLNEMPSRISYWTWAFLLKEKLERTQMQYFYELKDVSLHCDKSYIRNDFYTVKGL